MPSPSSSGRQGQSQPVNRNSVLQAAREAENQPTLFQATERGQYLKDMIEQVEGLKAAGKSHDDIKSEMAAFVENYPRLFEMVMRPSYDKTQLRTMLHMLSKMGTGELSQHQASMIVGQKLVNTYVTPAIRPPN